VEPPFGADFGSLPGIALAIQIWSFGVCVKSATLAAMARKLADLLLPHTRLV